MAGKGPGRSRDRGRGPLVVFGILFLLLLLGSMYYGGVGQAGVPDDAVAVVEGSPDGTITREEFDRALAQVAAQQGGGKVPKVGTESYKQLAGAVMQQLIINAWIFGEAEDRGIDVHRQVDQQIDRYLVQFGCSPDKSPEDCPEFQKQLDKAKITLPELEEQIEASLLGQKLDKEFAAGAPKPTDEQIQDYYETFKAQFDLPETRDVRLILNSDRDKVLEAKRQLEEDSSKRAWGSTALSFSTDTSKTTGGLREGLTEGLVEEPLNTQIFDADIGEIVGPVKTPLGYYVFEVIKVHTPRTQTLDEVKGQLRQQLKPQIEDLFKSEARASFFTEWSSRTSCAEGFSPGTDIDPTPDRVSVFLFCDNADGKNDFATRADKRTQAKSDTGVAAALRGRVAWPKPPNTLTPPFGAVGSTGTKIICALVQPAQGQPDPLTGLAPPQRPHPPGDDIDSGPDNATPGQVDSAMCGPVNQLGLTGTLPGAGAP
jgi:parvulin-like peptidyl-prolyl isomerase